jgi:putative membrane protein
MDPGINWSAWLESGWVGGLGALLVLLISLSFQVAIVALGVVVAWRWLHRPGGLATTTPPPRAKTSFEILDERYARGEIDTEEFEERKQRLMRRNA